MLFYPHFSTVSQIARVASAMLSYPYIQVFAFTVRLWIIGYQQGVRKSLSVSSPSALRI